MLAADTVVCIGSTIYGKASDAEQARETLTALSGRGHTVITAICLIEDNRIQTGEASTIVRFRSLGADLIDWYLASGEWRDRAGAYAIQGRGAALVQAIEGDYLNVVGLPVTTLLELAPGVLERTSMRPAR